MKNITRRKLTAMKSYKFIKEPDENVSEVNKISKIKKNF
jgi:hypothetical protein